jgi:hypothetical protein
MQNSYEARGRRRTGRSELVNILKKKSSLYNPKEIVSGNVTFVATAREFRTLKKAGNNETPKRPLRIL